MFGKKNHSWYWFALWSLFFSGFVYSISRFFLHAVNKESSGAVKKEKKVKKPQGTLEELFI
jgi:hypothetical protein